MRRLVNISSIRVILLLCLISLAFLGSCKKGQLRSDEGVVKQGRSGGASGEGEEGTVGKSGEVGEEELYAREGKKTPGAYEEQLYEEQTKAKHVRSARMPADLEIVYFAFDKATLTEEAMEKLDADANYLKAHPESTVETQGHCDERGSTEYNLALGERRARNVKTYLVDLGISADRLRTISFGEEKPSDPGNNEAAWAKNRRAEFVKQ